METFTINVPLTLTTRDIDDIVETAMEGGYSWFEGYGKSDFGGWNFWCEDITADTSMTYVKKHVPYAKLVEAIQTYYATYRTSTIAALSFEDDLAHQVDVNVADSIVQQAVYDEIVFA